MTSLTAAIITLNPGQKPERQERLPA